MLATALVCACYYFHFKHGTCSWHGWHIALKCQRNSFLPWSLWQMPSLETKALHKPIKPLIHFHSVNINCAQRHFWHLTMRFFLVIMMNFKRRMHLCQLCCTTVQTSGLVNQSSHSLTAQFSLALSLSFSSLCHFIVNQSFSVRQPTGAQHLQENHCGSTAAIVFPVLWDPGSSEH